MIPRLQADSTDYIEVSEVTWRTRFNILDSCLGRPARRNSVVEGLSERRPEAIQEDTSDTVACLRGIPLVSDCSLLQCAVCLCTLHSVTLNYPLSAFCHCLWWEERWNRNNVAWSNQHASTRRPWLVVLLHASQLQFHNMGRFICLQCSTCYTKDSFDTCKYGRNAQIIWRYYLSPC
jgi:hypothetical protein